MDPKDKKKSYSDLEAIITSSFSSTSSTSSPSAAASSASSTVPSSSSSSTLPSVDRHQSYWNEKFFAGPTSPDPKREIVNDGKGAKTEKDSLKEGASGMSPVDTLPPPPPAYYLVDSQGQTQALYTVPTSNSSDAGSIMNLKVGAAAAPAPQGWWASLGEGKRICGMRKNIFLAVMAGACALVLGLLATILVVTHAGAGRPRPDKGPSFSTKQLLSKGDSGPILAASDLAALNWTDTSTGTAYSGVFYQASHASGLALMVAFKNEKTQTWSSVNISASASNSQLDVLPGTPLAAASNNGLWNLYYLTSTMTIAEVYATDPTSNNGWQQGSFADVLNRPAVMPGSGLGAMWQSCTNCDNALFVTWQAAQSGAIVYANMTNLTWGQPVVLATAAAPGTGIVVNAYTDFGPKIKTGTSHSAVRWYYADNKGLEEMIKGPLGSGKILQGNFNKPVSTDLPSSPMPKLAGLTYGSDMTGWTSNFLTYICPMDGSLTSINWAPTAAWKTQAPSLDNSPDGLVNAGFSSVALTQEMKMYLVSPSNGEIHEYTTNATDPFAWSWTDKVDLSSS